ncbi:uncharacterized protein [Leptinotarsa decemlineata]|uniref:uncharacterized protein n=1 Tax=Leptinotarsa decemlineata TaxID=7539 RepID=UPI003D3066C0
MQSYLKRLNMGKQVNWQRFQAILCWGFSTSVRRNSFHDGLDLHLYHHIPSKHILDTFSSLGLTCSYNEVRQVTTSLAKQEIDDREDVPKCLGQVSNEKNNYIRASIDNLDLNDETFDGKRTTHAMTMVVFQEKQFSQPIRERIKEGSSALSKEETDISLQKIEKYVSLILVLYLLNSNFQQ